jgi:hypothetical protein
VVFASCSPNGVAIEVEEAPVETEDSTLPVHESPGRGRGRHAGSSAQRIIAMALRSDLPPPNAVREVPDPSSRRLVSSLEADVSVSEDICA